MLTLQRTVSYAGTNLPLIEQEFPSLTQVQVEFLIATYRFSKINNTNSVSRNFVKNELLTSSILLSSVRYKRDVELDLVTGVDYLTFLMYYAEYFKTNRNVAPDFQRFIDDLNLPVTVKLNAVTTQHFSALPFLFLTGDSSLVNPTEEGRITSVFASARRRTTSDKKLQQFLTENLYLLNLDALNKIILLLDNISLGSLFMFLSFTLKNEGDVIPTLAIPEYRDLMELIKVHFNSSITDTEYNHLKPLLTNSYKELFNFPLTIPEIKPVAVKGDVQFLGTDPVLFRDLSIYDLLLEEQLLAIDQPIPQTKSVKYTWGNFTATEIPNRKAPFDFQSNNNFVFDANAVSKVTITMRLYDGSELWKHTYAADDARQLSTLWHLGTDAKMGYESETMLGRYIGRNQWLLPYVGFDYHYKQFNPDEKNIFGSDYRNMFGQISNKEHRKTAVIGLAYTLPMLVVADARIDGNGKLRFQLGREDIPISKRLRGNFMVNTDKEYAAGMRYIITKYISLSSHYDSDMGLGGGLTFTY